MGGQGAHARGRQAVRSKVHDPVKRPFLPFPQTQAKKKAALKPKKKKRKKEKKKERKGNKIYTTLCLPGEKNRKSMAHLLAIQPLGTATALLFFCSVFCVHCVYQILQLGATCTSA